MQKKLSNKAIKKNISTSIAAQIISLCVSFLLNFAIPKFINEYQYAYWQTFALYLGYVGVFHFGLLDGIVLRYSQYNYEDLNRTVFRSMFLVLLISNSSIALFLCAFATSCSTEVTRITISLVAIGIVTKNVYTYNSFLLQITNRIDQYARIVIIQRVTHGFFVVVTLLIGEKNFIWYCIAELVGDVVSIITASFYNKGLYFGRMLHFREAFIEWKNNVSSGSMLMLASWSSILLLSGAKLIVQWHWGDLFFGKVAFSFSICNLFLAFVTAVSVVLFPALKRMEQDKLPTLYKQLRNILSPVLLLALICYFPGCWIIKLMLPRYTESLPYLGVVLPMVLFTSKTNLLTNNYLKAYRKEKMMLWINLFSVMLAFTLFSVCAYVFDNLIAVLVCVVVSTMANSILSEIIVMHTIRIRIVKDFLAEILLTFIFIVSTLRLNSFVACISYVCALIIYIIVFRKNLRIFKHIIRK